MRITAKHPIRSICDLPNYWNTKAEAIAAIADKCIDNDIYVEIGGMPGDEGRACWKLCPIDNARVVCDCCDKKLEDACFDNCLFVSWYTMPSGRIELTVYIS